MSFQHRFQPCQRARARAGDSPPAGSPPTGAGRTILVVVLFTLFTFAFASAQVSVSVSSPTSGATVGSSFTLNASASSPNGVTGWYVYVDNNAAWNTPGPASSISAPLNLGSGSHSIRVRAWDTRGSYGDGMVSVSVNSSISPAGTSVSVSSPANGASVGNSVNIVAGASSPNGISGWVVYMDNQNVYQVDNYSTNLNAWINMPSGQHSVYVRAWDRLSGYGTSPTFTLNVGTTSSSSSSSSSQSTGFLTPPSNATVVSQIEETPDSQWRWCADCAGSKNLTWSYWTAAYQSSPSMDGASRQFYVGGPPWSAALFYHKLNQSSSSQYNWATHFIWDFWVYVDSASLNNVWTFEFDLYQALGGWEYMIGTHCSIGDGYWYGWNQAQNRWVQMSNAPCRKSDWTPGQWHHVVWYMERIPGTHNYQYDGLQMDDRSYAMNMVQPASPIDWSDVVGVQWQVDTNGNGGDVHWWVDKVKVTMW